MAECETSDELAKSTGDKSSAHDADKPLDESSVNGRQSKSKKQKARKKRNGTDTTSDSQPKVTDDKIAGTSNKDENTEGTSIVSEATEIKREKEEENHDSAEKQQTKKGESPEAAASESSGGTSEENGTKTLDEESEDEGIEDLGNPEELDGAGRNTLFERAKQYEAKGKKQCALKCYLQCLTGLKDTSGFTFLPQCLRKIADLYFEKEEFEKAIQFIQAEKMFYETALIDTSQLQTKLELAQQSKDEDGEPETEDIPTPDELRADEYENLARLCLIKKQAKLALEYQGKATKLRQKLYGEQDPRTIKSLDFFTVVYAEVGKQQYTESLGRLEEDPGPEGDQGSPTSILRRRKKKEADAKAQGDGEKKQVRFENPPVTSEQLYEREVAAAAYEREEMCSRVVLLSLFFVCLLVLLLISAILYCRLSLGSYQCMVWRNKLKHAYNVVSYYFHVYTAPGINVG